MSIGMYEVKKQDRETFIVKWDQCPLEEYPVPRPMFDYVGIYAHTVGREFVPYKEMEDHWLNWQDDYEI